MTSKHTTNCETTPLTSPLPSSKQLLTRSGTVLTPEDIEKKLRLSIGLFEAAFEIKKHQLQKKHPEKSDYELNYMTMDLIEKGAR